MKDALSALTKIVGSHGMVCLDTVVGTLSTSNHSQWATVPYQFPKSIGKFSVNYSTLSQFIKTTSGEISISLEGSMARFGHLGSSLLLPADFEEKWSPVGNVVYGYQQIIDLDVWKTVASVVGGTEDNPEFGGISLGKHGLAGTFRGKLIMWARLDYRDAPEIVLPAKFIGLFEDGAILHCAERMVKISTSAATYEGKLINDRFPDFKRAIPEPENSFMLDIQELRDAIKTTSVVNDVIVLDVKDGSCLVTAVGANGLKAESTISASGDAVKFECFSKQLLLATQMADDTVRVQFSDAISPMRIDHEIYTSVICPRYS